MPGGYVVAEAIFVMALIITASSFASTFFTFFQELEQANKEQIDKIKRQAGVSVEPIFGYVSDDRLTIFLWIKNAGRDRISFAEVETSEVFVIGRNIMLHVPYGVSQPGWRYSLVKEFFNDNGWSWGETLLLTVSLNHPLQPGEYIVKVAGMYTSINYVVSVGG